MKAALLPRLLLYLLSSAPAAAQPLRNLFSGLLAGKLQCALTFLALDFNISDYSRYGEYFRDSSTMTLAEAGNYYGADNIEEYVGFTDSITSQFLAENVRKAEQARIVGVNSNGQCEFLLAYVDEYRSDPAFTSRATAFDYSALVKLKVETGGLFGFPSLFRPTYIDRANVFFSKPFLNFFFIDLLASNNTRAFICDDVLAGSCSGVIAPTTDCLERLEELPYATDDSRVDGNSQGCRALHASFALRNPTNHCPHVALNATADGNGVFKCQASDYIAVSDLFTANDLLYYENFLADYGMDPSQGYQILDP